MKECIGNCVSNPFPSPVKLADIIDNAREITKRTFLKHCVINMSIERDMKEYPYDFTFFKNGKIYFYTHSAVEYFYK